MSSPAAGAGPGPGQENDATPASSIVGDVEITPQVSPSPLPDESNGNDSATTSSATNIVARSAADANNAIVAEDNEVVTFASMSSESSDYDDVSSIICSSCNSSSSSRSNFFSYFCFYYDDEDLTLTKNDAVIDEDDSVSSFGTTNESRTASETRDRLTEEYRQGGSIEKGPSSNALKNPNEKEKAEVAAKRKVLENIGHSLYDKKLELFHGNKLKEANHLEHLAKKCSKDVQWDQAEKYLLKALKLKRKAYKDQHKEVIKTLKKIAFCRIGNGSYERAIKPTVNALTLLRKDKKLSRDDAEIVGQLHLLEILYRKTGDAKKKEKVQEEIRGLTGEQSFTKLLVLANCSNVNPAL